MITSFLRPLSVCCAVVCLLASSMEANAELYEIRGYVLGADGDSSMGDEQAVDQYLSEALLPALKRSGVGPVGVFTNSEDDETGIKTVFVVIPYADPAAMGSSRAQVQSDEQYQKDAEEFFKRGNRNKAYQRIESELLVAMACMPEVKVPEGALENDERVFELRIYESANEKLGNLKVDMFNNGEVPIFLDCGITPIFIGQSIVGPYTPNLTYLTMYPDEASRGKAWDAFRVHPDWKVLSRVAKYKGTVSKIHKYVLVPKSYSQM
ncbi:MAG: NIPSNAP family protein [Planctomycetota bacterium]